MEAFLFRMYGTLLSSTSHRGKTLSLVSFLMLTIPPPLYEQWHAHGASLESYTCGIRCVWVAYRLTPTPYSSGHGSRTLLRGQAVISTPFFYRHTSDSRKDGFPRT